MHIATDHHSVSDVAHLRLADLAALRVWGDVCGLDVTIQPADAGLSGEMAFIGSGGGGSSWCVYCINRRLWLAYLPNPSRECLEGWTVEIGSVVDAMALIIADTES